MPMQKATPSEIREQESALKPMSNDELQARMSAKQNAGNPEVQEVSPGLNPELREELKKGFESLLTSPNAQSLEILSQDYDDEVIAKEILRLKPGTEGLDTLELPIAERLAKVVNLPDGQAKVVIQKDSIIPNGVKEALAQSKVSTNLTNPQEVETDRQMEASTTQPAGEGTRATPDVPMVSAHQSLSANSTSEKSESEMAERGVLQGAASLKKLWDENTFLIFLMKSVVFSFMYLLNRLFGVGNFKVTENLDIESRAMSKEKAEALSGAVNSKSKGLLASISPLLNKLRNKLKINESGEISNIEPTNAELTDADPTNAHPTDAGPTDADTNKPKDEVKAAEVQSAGELVKIAESLMDEIKNQYANIGACLDQDTKSELVATLGLKVDSAAEREANLTIGRSFLHGDLSKRQELVDNAVLAISQNEDAKTAVLNLRSNLESLSLASSLLLSRFALHEENPTGEANQETLVKAKELLETIKDTHQATERMDNLNFVVDGLVALNEQNEIIDDDRAFNMADATRDSTLAEQPTVLNTKLSPSENTEPTPIVMDLGSDNAPNVSNLTDTPAQSTGEDIHKSLADFSTVTEEQAKAMTNDERLSSLIAGPSTIASQGLRFHPSIVAPLDSTRFQHLTPVEFYKHVEAMSLDDLKILCAKMKMSKNESSVRMEGDRFLPGAVSQDIKRDVVYASNVAKTHKPGTPEHESANLLLGTTTNKLAKLYAEIIREKGALKLIVENPAFKSPDDYRERIVGYETNLKVIENLAKGLSLADGQFDRKKIYKDVEDRLAEASARLEKTLDIEPA